MRSIAERPIGVFDSGVGGLTVLAAVRRLMPRESLTYFGDTAHLPYGSKSREAVTRYSLEAGEFLVREGIKLLVVACNTASALALERLRRSLGIPVVGVIQPGVRAAAAAVAAGGRTVGIIATEATVASLAYQRALRGLLPGVRVRAAACPLFVPLVEEGWWSHPVTRRVASEYLRPLARRRMDALILGCTHYPLLKPALRRAVGPGTRLIDSAQETALEVERRLSALGLRSRGSRARHRFFVSDGPERFLRLARRLLGMRIHGVRVHRIGALLLAGALWGGCVSGSPQVGGPSDAVPFEDMTLQNVIRWPSGRLYIEGIGSGRPPEGEKDPEVRRRAARDAAAVEAQRALIAQLERLVPRERIQELLRRAEVGREEYGYDDGCTLTLRLPREEAAGTPPVE